MLSIEKIEEAARFLKPKLIILTGLNVSLETIRAMIFLESEQ